MPAAPRNQPRVFVIYASVVGLVIMSLLGVVLVLLSGPVQPALIMQSVGLNVLSSVVWAGVIALSTTWVVNRVRDDELHQFLDEHGQLILTEVKSRLSSFEDTLHLEAQRTMGALTTWRPTYLPIRTYPPTQGFDDSFNRDLMEQLSSTKEYTFQGPSARYVAPRLSALRKLPDRVHIAMTDPRHRASVDARAADRKSTATYEQLEVGQIAERLQEELIGSVISLFDLRQRCRVEIALISDEAIYRYELTDSALFFSWYHSPNSGGKVMPEAMQFAADSMLYRVLDLESRRRMDSSHLAKISFRSDATEQDLVQVVRDLLGDHSADVNTVAHYRRRHAELVARFVEYLTDGKVRGVF